VSQLSNVHSSGSKRRTQCPNAFRVSGTVLRPSRILRSRSATTSSFIRFIDIGVGVSLTLAWGNNGAATETESITWKDTGYAKSLLISYGIHRLRRFAFEVNGEHVSVAFNAGLRWLLDSRRWRRRRNYHSLMSPIDTAIRRRTTVKCRRQLTSTVL